MKALKRRAYKKKVIEDVLAGRNKNSDWGTENAFKTNGPGFPAACPC